MNVWLCQMTLDLSDRDTRLMMADATSLHRFVMRLLPDDIGDSARQQAGLLFRVESLGQMSRILVQTQVPPNTERFTGPVSVAIRSLAPILERIEVGRRFRYRIVANPTKKIGSGAKDRAAIGKRHVLRDRSAEEWWLRKAMTHGFSCDSVKYEPLPDISSRNGIRHAAAVFEGTVSVSNSEVARSAVLGGIGRGKPYGCGLLSLGAP